MSPRVRCGLACLVLSLSGMGCELTEVALVLPEDRVVVEGLVEVREAFGVLDRVYVYLHRTLGPGESAPRVPGARVEVRLNGAREPLVLEEAPVGGCAATTPFDAEGTCYALLLGQTMVGPGDRLTLVVELPDGGRITGATRVPGSFGLLDVPAYATCTVPPNETIELSWTSSEDAWSYIAEAAIMGLPEALADLGIEAEDPLHLTGLAVSAKDTTLVFPSELGVFERAELDQDLARVLQEGLPAGTRAAVAIVAADRNLVNWQRGGTFNPTGQIRIPSVVGDGTGFFGSSVIYPFQVRVAGPGDSVYPRCGPPPSASSRGPA